MWPDKVKTGYNMKVKNTSFIWFAIILSFGVMYVLYANKIMSDLTSDFLEDLIYSSTDTFSQNIRAKIRYVESIAAMSVITDENVPFEKKLNGLESIVEQSEITRLLLIDLDGNGITNTGERVHITNREYYEKALDGETNMTYPLVSVFGEAWVTVIAVPVIDKESSRIVAVLAAGIDENGFIPLHQNVNNIYESSTHIFGRRFDYALTIEDMNGRQEINFIPDLSLGNEHLESFVVAQLIKENGFADNDVGYAEYIFEGIPKYLVYVAVEGTDFILATAIEKNTIFYEIRNAVTLNNSLTLFILIVLSAVVFYNMMLNTNIKIQQEKTNLAVDVTKLLIIGIDRKHNKVKSFNDNALILLGYPRHELIDKNIFELLAERNIHGEFWKQVDKVISEALSASIELPIYRKNGSILYAMWKVDCSSPGIYEFFGSDISELKTSQEKINQLAYFDQLTGLSNKISLENYVRDTLREDNAKFAFICIDIDNFKYVIDTFGCSVGDEIILEMSDRIVNLNKSITNSDKKEFRVSGDEFVIIYHDFQDYGEVGDYSNLVYNTICQEYKLEKMKISITVSIGVSLYPDYAPNMQEVFKTAEIAMINAKEQGKSRVIFFSHQMRKEIEAIAYMSADLEDALRKREFVLYYQPQYDTKTGEIYGYEALMRWISSKRGVMMPGEFIPYAEKNHLINKMGIWAFEEASLFANEVCKLGYDNIKISVNISLIQLLDEDFVRSILSVLERTKVNVKNICLEVTESIFMESIDTSIVKIKQLNDVGIKFALEDFGTGFSSLTYLKQLPVETLKIDKSFIRKLLDSDSNIYRQIVVAIINLAHSLDLKVVAEGVEEKEQWDWLRQENCDICQGYYNGRPLPKAEAVQCLVG